MVIAHFPNVHFTLAGRDANAQFQLEFNQKHSVDITSKVTFAGLVEQQELNTLYEHCDLFVAPSRYESFGLVYIEAMARAKPVVGCRAGGIPEVVSEGQTGLLTPPGDVSALAESICMLLGDERLRQNLGQAARKRSIELFSQEKMVEKTIELYRTILKNK